MQVGNIEPIGGQAAPLHQVPGQFVNFSPAAKTPGNGHTGPDAIRLANLEKVLSEHSISLKFSKDDTTKALVVEMVDERTGEEIRQFPTEVSLALAANFIKLQGHLLDVSK